MRKIIYISLFVLLCFTSFAQKSDSLMFAKGRVITSLYGSLSNKQIQSTTSNGSSHTGYTIGSKSGQFIKNNWVLGVNFALSKTEYDDKSIRLDIEDMLLGLWSRLYFARKGSTSLYVDLTTYYKVVYANRTIYNNIGRVVTHNELFGSGFGFDPGLGFTYNLNRNVGFGMTISSPVSWLYTNSEDLINKTSSSSNYVTSQIQFRFNFQIYIDQFFF